MTLFKQLFFGASLLFLLMLAGVEAIYLSNARYYMQQQLEVRSQDAAASLGIWLGNVRPFDDRARIEAVVDTAFDRGDYQSIRVVSAKHGMLLEKTLDTGRDSVPLWFTQIFPLHTPTAESLISAEGLVLGRVVVASHPQSAYQQLWHTASQTLLLLLLVYALALLALRAFLRNILQPMREIELAAVAIGERNFKSMDVASKTREFGRVVSAMNSLSSKIKKLIDDETARAESLKREAYVDPVTGLLNRRGIEHDLHGLSRSDRDVFAGAFLLLQLEGFRDYNLQHGFQKADELLLLVAQTIAGACVGRSAVCSRFGGASFAVLALNVDAPAAGAIAAGIAARVDAMLAEQSLAGKVAFNCGMVHFDAGAPTLPELLGAADLALTRALAKGSGTFDLVELSELNRRGRGSLAWREHIERAIDGHGLALYSQQVLSLPQHELLQSEIVTRLVEDGSTPVPAAQFLPMAARHRLMPKLDCRFLDMLIASIDAGAKVAPIIAINVSAQTVADAAACHQMISTLQKRPDVAARLVFEMTEFGVIQGPAISMGFATEIRLLGAQFAIDNFISTATHCANCTTCCRITSNSLRLTPVN